MCADSLSDELGPDGVPLTLDAGMEPVPVTLAHGLTKDAEGLQFEYIRENLKQDGVKGSDETTLEYLYEGCTCTPAPIHHLYDNNHLPTIDSLPHSESSVGSTFHRVCNDQPTDTPSSNPLHNSPPAPGDCVAGLCPCVDRFGAAYDEAGRLRGTVEPYSRAMARGPVVECGAACACSSACGQRMVQGGVRWRLQVVGAGPRGLGVRTLQGIPRNAFVCEYVGEVVTRGAGARVGGEGEEKVLGNLGVKQKVKANYLLTIRESIGASETSAAISGRDLNLTDGSIVGPESSGGPEFDLTDGSVAEPGSTSGRDSECFEGSRKRLGAIECIPRSHPENSRKKRLRLDPNGSVAAVVPNEASACVVGSVGGASIIVRCTHIDARRCGNVARLINHSCAPNLFMLPVRLGSTDPVAALFALRDIAAGEELCYDYSGDPCPALPDEGEGPESLSEVVSCEELRDPPGKDFWDGGERTVCCCGAVNCRGFLPSDPDAPYC